MKNNKIKLQTSEITLDELANVNGGGLTSIVKAINVIGDIGDAYDFCHGVYEGWKSVK